MNLTVSKLTKTFTRADERIELFRDFSMTLKAGEAVTVLGPSGSGKTTLLRMIAGLEPPDDGTILFDGQDIFRMPPEERRAFRLRHIGFLAGYLPRELCRAGDAGWFRHPTNAEALQVASHSTLQYHKQCHQRQ